jgi:hypothetical protein
MIQCFCDEKHSHYKKLEVSANMTMLFVGSTVVVYSILIGYILKNIDVQKA